MMLDPPVRERAFNAPAVIVLVIALLVAIHAGRMFLLTEQADFETLIDYAFVPLRFLGWFAPDEVRSIIDGMIRELPAENAARQLAMAHYLMADGEGHPYTVVTYALLHGDWGHLAINCASLLAFGSPLARRLGAPRTLAMLLVTAIGGIIVHFAFHSGTLVPVIGASAAASGVMAAASRFIFASGGLSGSLADDGPVRSIGEIVRDRRTLAFIGLWFILNLIFGVGAEPLGLAPGGIAWEAHVGGFVTGFMLMPLIDRKREPMAA